MADSVFGVQPELHGDRARDVVAPCYQNGAPVTLADVKRQGGLAAQNMPVGAPPHPTPGLTMGTAEDEKGTL